MAAEKGNRIIERPLPTLPRFHQPAAACDGFQSGGIRSPRSKRRYFSAVQSLPHRAIPESRPQFASIKTPSMPLRSRYGPGRTFRRCRSCTRGGHCRDRIRNSIPRVSVKRVADASCDRADAHVTVIDVPAFFAGIGRSAAGESGHAPLKRGLGGSALVSGSVVSRGCSVKAMKRNGPA